MAITFVMLHTFYKMLTISQLIGHFHDPLLQYTVINPTPRIYTDVTIEKTNYFL